MFVDVCVFAFVCVYLRSQLRQPVKAKFSGDCRSNGAQAGVPVPLKSSAS